MPAKPRKSAPLPQPANTNASGPDDSPELLTNIEGEGASDNASGDNASDQVNPPEDKPKPLISADALEQAKAQVRDEMLARMEKQLTAKALKRAQRQADKAAKQAERASNAKARPGTSSRNALGWREAQPVTRPVHASFSLALAPCPQKDVVYADATTPVATIIKLVGLEYLEAYTVEHKGHKTVIKGPGIAVDFQFQATLAGMAEPTEHRVVRKFGPGEALPWILMGFALNGVADGTAIIHETYTPEIAASNNVKPPPLRQKKGTDKPADGSDKTPADGTDKPADGSDETPADGTDKPADETPGADS